MWNSERVGFRGPLAAAFAAPVGRTEGLHDALRDLLLPPGDSLPVAGAEDRAVWHPERGSADTATLRFLTARARAELAEPWPQPLASAAARVHRDGDRATWEALAFARQQRLSRAAVAAAVTLDDDLLDAAADGILLLCEQSSWCWPAHDDAYRLRGSILADPASPFLDLGAGEVVAQLAWADQLLGVVLEERYPGLRRRIRQEARRRVIEPFLHRDDWHWLGLDGDVHNWNPWIHGNVLVAALRLLDGDDEQDERAATIALVIRGLDRYIAALPEDGAVDEGLGYWWNGACRALEALELLAHATGGALDAASVVPALRATVAFPHRMHLGGDWYLNFADAQARLGPELPWHALHRAARAAGDTQALAHAASHRRPGEPAATETEGLGRLVRGLSDTAWLTAAPTTHPLPRSTWLPSVQIMVERQHAGSPRGLTLAGKGGHNGEHHNHNDIGSFIVASDGVPVVVDAGRPTYTRETFGQDRYRIWTMQSSWHNVPEIAGADQGVGRSFAAAVGHRPGQLVLELRDAYPVPGLRSWQRELQLDHDTVRITDSWILSPADAPTALHLLLAGTVELLPAGARVAPVDDARSILLEWPGLTATAEVRRLDDPLLREIWGSQLSRVSIDVTGRSRASISVSQEE